MPPEEGQPTHGHRLVAGLAQRLGRLQQVPLARVARTQLHQEEKQEAPAPGALPRLRSTQKIAGSLKKTQKLLGGMYLNFQVRT